jgi:hypothetical protein
VRTNEISNEVNLTRACWEWMRSTPNHGGMIRKFFLDEYPQVFARDIYAAAGLLESKQELLEENKPAALSEYERFLDEIPDDLMSTKCIPSRLLYMLPPYKDKNAALLQSLSRTLSRDYPLVKVGTSQDGKVRIKDGVNTTFRVIEKGMHLHLSSPELKNIYALWEPWVEARVMGWAGKKY